jgi:type IV secretory pathway VirB2 component (pilin)
MKRGKKAALVVIGIVLFISLISANAAIALDRTALDADYAKETAEEADLYGTVAEEIRGQIATGASGGGDLPLERSQDELLGAALTDEYIQSQINSNIDRLYAYLNGDTDELRLGLDPEPLKEQVIAEVQKDVEDLDLADIDMPFATEIDAMAESEAQFQQHREEFRAEQKQRIQERTDRELSDQQLEAVLDDRMDTIREEMNSELDTRLDGQFTGAEAELEAPVRDLQSARIDALTGALTYEEYTAEVDTATNDLGDAFVAVFESELDEQIPETIDLTNELSQQDQEMLETVRTVTSVSGPIAYGLFVLALVLAGLIAWLAPPKIAAIEVGLLSALVGIVGILGAVFAADQLRATIPEGGSMGMEAFMLEFTVGIFDALRWQSVGLLLVGIVLTAVGIALWNGYIELPETYADR